MKKVLALFLILVFILSACNASSGNKNKETSENMNSSQPLNTNRTWPVVSGTFMQPGSFMNYSVTNWETHFNNLLEVGVDIFIIQWTSETPYGKFKSCYYPSKYVADNKIDGYFDGSALLEKVLQAAEKTGVKVFIGLNLSDEWWNIAATQNDWCGMQSDLGIKMAQEIYTLYKAKYPNAVHGWYFAWEMYNGMGNNYKAAADFLNGYLDPLTLLDSSMPLMLSPFVRTHGGTAEEAGNEWAEIFKLTNFRDGDIFCCQDAVGAGWIEIDQLDSYFKNLKRACDTKPGLKFWANSENFTLDSQSAELGRFIKQMKIAQPYVEGYVTFAYSHYYSKDYLDKAPYHNAYKYYYESGCSEVTIKQPEIRESVNDNYTRIFITVFQTGFGLKSMTITEGEKILREYSFSKKPTDKQSLELMYTFNHSDNIKNITITLTDYFGASISLDHTLNK
ncbi:DUF4434 domain-containing protein [Eubacteriales bacterium OttesenSCG-928-G02]|nr:DUF4434 domain-containing protein [Eubacteriales bacterium OttesenSCG-928-G02]